MFPDTLFELWGRGPKKREFLKPEVEEREELREIEKCPQTDETETCKSKLCVKNSEVLNVSGSDHINVDWIRREATLFHENILKHGREGVTHLIMIDQSIFIYIDD